MRIALVDSGVGLLAAAAVLRSLRPDADLILSSDPDGMPWGPRTQQDVTERALMCALAAAEHRPDALVVACNTATVNSLDALRARFEPGIPVIGTVPAIKPAAAAGGPVAIWATPATTGSTYQRRLIAEFADGVEVAEVGCTGLADALDRADEEATAAAIEAAAARTPRGVRAVVLGCTHYELAADRIGAAVGTFEGPAVVLHGSAHAVAAQALRRIGAAPDPGAAPSGTLTVLLSGRRAELPEAALRYAEGRALASAAPAR